MYYVHKTLSHKNILLYNILEHLNILVTQLSFSFGKKTQIFIFTLSSYINRKSEFWMLGVWGNFIKMKNVKDIKVEKSYRFCVLTPWLSEDLKRCWYPSSFYMALEIDAEKLTYSLQSWKVRFTSLQPLVGCCQWCRDLARVFLPFNRLRPQIYP